MENKQILPYKTPKTAVQEAYNQILAERTGEQYGLYCEFHALNVSMGKYFRFNSVNLWAGLSGHGKSYLLNKLNKDFLEIKKGQLNGNINFIPIILHFCFEMSAYNEILRAIAGDMGVSYNYLLSSQYDKDSQSYNMLSDEDMIKVKEYLSYYQNKNILFFEVSGNVKEIYETTHYIISEYKSKEKERNVTYKFIVNIDHTLLIENFDEKTNLDLMANVGKIAIKIRKEFDAMINLLGQLNNNIEDIRRLTTPALHYPQKSDIYAQGQLYNACDNVFVIHQPELLKITTYGNNHLPTKSLVHLIKLKSRHGNVGSVWFINNLDKGRFELIKMEEIKDYHKNLNSKENDEIPEHL